MNNYNRWKKAGEKGLWKKTMPGSKPFYTSTILPKYVFENDKKVQNFELEKKL